MDDLYVLIAEYKAEEQLVIEQSLHTASYNKIYTKLHQLERDPNIVRVCMAKLQYERGNKNLMKGNYNEN